MKSLSSWKNFDFVKNNKKKLVVTIGESWTWGDSLESSWNPRSDNKEFRLSNVYGGQLAAMLDADFLNLAIPGESNLWITNHLKLFAENLNDFNYEEIYVVLTLTEVGREFQGNLDKNRNYIQDLKDVQCFDDFLNCLSSYITDNILSLNNSKFKLIIGTNFVDSNYSDKLSVLPKSWVDIIAEKMGTTLAKPCYVSSYWVFEKFDHLLSFCPNYSTNEFLTDKLNAINLSAQRDTFLLDNPYNYKTPPRKHLTANGHKLWAEYLYETICQR